MQVQTLVSQLLILMIGEPAANCVVFASLWSSLEHAPVTEDKVEELNSALETRLDSFLWSRLEEVPGALLVAA